MLIPTRRPAYTCARAVALAALVFAAAPSHAQTFLWLHPDVPDANQPAASALGVACTADFSAPTAAANLLNFWDTQTFGPYGHPNAAAVTGGLSGSQLAEHLSWFLATNSRRDSACAAGAVDTWGRTNARTGSTAGTRTSDLAPGLTEFVRWDAGLYPFAGPVSPPPLPAGKVGYNWRVETILHATELPDAAIIDAYTQHIVTQPLIATFQHWHLSFLCAEGGIEYYDWLPPVSGTDDPLFAPTYAGAGTPPPEQWNVDNRGHAVIGVGLHSHYQPSCTAAPRDWFIVHDAIANTGANVAVPFYYDPFYPVTWMTSLTIVGVTANDVDLAFSPSGARHVVWEDSRTATYPFEQGIFYARNAVPDTALTGTPFGLGSDPSIAIDSSTGAIAIAHARDQQIRVATSLDGGNSWSISDPISYGSGPSQHPSIAIDSASNVHVVWQAGCDGEPWCGFQFPARLWSSSKPAGGSWGAPQPVPSGGALGDTHPDLATDGSRLYLSFDHAHEAIDHVEGNVSGGAITWDGDSLHTVNVAAGHPVRAPAIEVDSGDVYVVWSDQRSGTWQTYHQARRAGSWLAADLALSTASTSATAPDLALHTASGGTHVYASWEEELPAGNYEIVTVSLSHDGSGIVNPVPQNRSATAAPSHEPAIAYNAGVYGGEIDLAWSEDPVRLLPEPGAAGLLGGIAALARLRRRRSR